MSIESTLRLHDQNVNANLYVDRSGATWWHNNEFFLRVHESKNKRVLARLCIATVMVIEAAQSVDTLLELNFRIENPRLCVYRANVKNLALNTVSLVTKISLNDSSQ